MSVTEHGRQLLRDALLPAIGEEAVEVLMDHLPPGGWGDLARRADLESVRRELELQIEKSASDLRAEIATLGAGFHREMVRQTWVLAGALLSAAGVLGGLLR